MYIICDQTTSEVELLLLFVFVHSQVAKDVPLLSATVIVSVAGDDDDGPLLRDYDFISIPYDFTIQRIERELKCDSSAFYFGTQAATEEDAHSRRASQ